MKKLITKILFILCNIVMIFCACIIGIWRLIKFYLYKEASK